MPQLKILETKFENLRSQTKKEFSMLHETNRTIITTINVIKENHLAHMSEKISNMENKVGSVMTEIAWLKKVQWFIATTAISSLIGIIYVILQ